MDKTKKLLSIMLGRGFFMSWSVLHIFYQVAG